MRRSRWEFIGLLVFWFVLGAIGWLVGRAIVNAYDGCEPEPITVNTPTGIAGCEVWGEGIASHYGPGNGVAMNWCTWEVHAGHSRPCGWVTIQSHQTGITVTVPVVDFCDCYTGTPDERIVDLQYGVVDALGLNWEAGLYHVTVWREGDSSHAAGSGEQPPGELGGASESETAATPTLPDTAMATP